MEPDECPDFDDTLRNMLGSPPVRHKRQEDEPEDGSSVQTPAEEAQDDETDG